MNKKNVAIGILAGTTLYFWLTAAYILAKHRALETKYVNLARMYAHLAREYNSAMDTIDKQFYDIVKDI